MQTVLETNRLVLKSVNGSDSGKLYDFLMRNREFFKPWSPAYPDDYDTPGYHHKTAQNIEEETIAGRQLKFAVYKKENPDVIFGTVALSNIIKGAFLSCFLGYRIDEKENSKGYATEALREAVNFTFEVIKLHRVEANIIPRNKASIRVMEKLGFINEGISKKYLKINGIWEDHLHYVLLNSKYEL